MARISKKTYFLALTVVLLVAAGFVFWLYGGQMTPLKNKIFTNIPLPMALVNGRVVTVKDYLDRVALANHIGASAGATTAQTASNVYREMILESEVRQIAQSRGIFVSQGDLRQGMANFSSSTPSLADYGVSQDYFKTQILEPALFLVNLQVWFNSQQNLNQQTYSQASDLIAQIKNSGNMAALAASYSIDSVSAPLGGDLGFVQPSQLLPELREPVAGMAIGDTKLLPSRLGLHIIKVEGTNGNSVEIREILLPCTGFQTWLQNQEANFKIVNFLNF